MFGCTKMEQLHGSGVWKTRLDIHHATLPGLVSLLQLQTVGVLNFTPFVEQFKKKKVAQATHNNNCRRLQWFA